MISPTKGGWQHFHLIWRGLLHLFFAWPAHQSVWMDVTSPKPSLVTRRADFLTPSYHNIDVMLAPLVYGVGYPPPSASHFEDAGTHGIVFRPSNFL